MKIKTCLFCLLVFAFVFSGCAPAAAPTQIAAAPAAPAAPALAAAPAVLIEKAAGSVDRLQESDGDGIGQSAPVANRIVIKNAVLSIIVKDPALSMERIGKMAEEMGGFIVDSNIRTVQSDDGTEIPQATISIRVPAQRLMEAMDLIKNETGEPGKGVVNEQISGSDVTQEYTDLQSRLTNLNNASKQLNAIMENAKKTEDVIEVYKQLKDVNEQIEIIKGQIKYYEEASSLSGINVTLISADSVKPISVAGWEPVGIARDAIQLLVRALQGLIGLVIWLILFLLPFLVVLSLLFIIPFVIIRKIVKAIKTPRNKKTPDA